LFGDGELVGSDNSWELSNYRNFTHPTRTPSRRQRLLEDQRKAGIPMHQCARCGDLYKGAKHSCRRKNVAETSTTRKSTNVQQTAEKSRQEACESDDEESSESECDEDSSSSSSCDSLDEIKVEEEKEIIEPKSAKRAREKEVPLNILNNNNNNNNLLAKRCTCDFEYEIGDSVYAEFASPSDRKWAVCVWEGNIRDIFHHTGECMMPTQYFIYFAEDESWWVMTNLEIWPVSKGTNFKHCVCAPDVTPEEPLSSKRPSRYRKLNKISLPIGQS
jgi:hypothetical protein